MKLKYGLCFVVCILASATTVAAVEGFQGILFGMTKSQVERKTEELPFCEKSMDICEPGPEIMGFPRVLQFVYSSGKGNERLIQIRLYLGRFDKGTFVALEKALHEKYGTIWRGDKIARRYLMRGRVGKYFEEIFGKGDVSMNVTKQFGIMIYYNDKELAARDKKKAEQKANPTVKKGKL